MKMLMDADTAVVDQEMFDALLDYSGVLATRAQTGAPGWRHDKEGTK